MQEHAEDPDAFCRLFTSFSRPVLAYALRRVREPSDAADVLAETFLVAWRRRDALPPGDDGLLWLFGVARRVLANQRRGERRRSALADRIRAQLERQVEHDPAETKAWAMAVEQALGRLDDDDRELLLLTGAEGLSPAEVAVVLDIPRATARTRLHRARRRLRAELWRAEDRGEQPLAFGHAQVGGHTLAQDRDGQR